MQLEDLIKAIRHSFTIPQVKKAVLDAEWFEKNNNSGVDSTGFCFAACQVIYKCSGQKEKWTIKIISRTLWEYGSHYYLQDKITGEILDITSDQYSEKGISIPYTLGKGTGIRGYSKGKILAGFLGVTID